MAKLKARLEFLFYACLPSLIFVLMVYFKATVKDIAYMVHYKKLFAILLFVGPFVLWYDLFPHERSTRKHELTGLDDREGITK